MSNAPSNSSAASVASSQARPSVQTTSTLLRIGLAGPTRPVDELLARLEASDGPAWLSAALAGTLRAAGVAPADGPAASPEHLLCDGAASAAQLETIKDHGKRLLKAAITLEGRCAGLAAYFFSIAAALKHHDTLIGARRADGGPGPRDELHHALLDLASSTNQPWTSMLGEAALRAQAR